jgi:hypothetical protein
MSFTSRPFYLAETVSCPNCIDQGWRKLRGPVLKMFESFEETFASVHGTFTEQNKVLISSIINIIYCIIIIIIIINAYYNYTV